MASTNSPWKVLITVACGTFMATLDSSIVNIALPTLVKEFNATLPMVKWVVVIYLLAITCTLLVFGKLADLLGKKRIFLVGFAIFGLGSLLCSISPTIQLLIFSRVIQGIGASMLMANGPAIITAAFPSNERGSALGIMAMVVSAGLVTGPSLGGVMITYLGWKSIFIVNLPIAVLGIVFGAKYLKILDRYHQNKVQEITKATGDTNPFGIGKMPPFDWAGATLQFLILLCIVGILDPWETSGVPRGWLIFLLGVTVPLFIFTEKNAPSPLVEWSLLKNNSFLRGNLANFLVFVAYASVTLLMPFFLEEVMHMSTHKAGLFMTAIPLTIFVVAPISGKLSDKIGSQVLCLFGAGLGAIGLFIISGIFGPGLRSQISRLEIVLALCVVGLGTGLFQSPNNNAIMGEVPREKLGAASAMLATIRNLGLMTGTGLAISLYSIRLQETADVVSALHFTHFSAGVVGLGAVLVSLGKNSKWVGRKKKKN